MIKLETITDNLNTAVDKYNNLPLIETTALSEVLRDLGVNLAHLTIHRNDYYSKWQSVYFNSQGKTDAAKGREADQKVQELYFIRQIMKYYDNLRQDIRTQISLHKAH